MTLFDAISKSIQSLAVMAIGAILGLVMLVWVASTFTDMLLTGAETLRQASDGIAWEGRE